MADPLATRSAPFAGRDTASGHEFESGLPDPNDMPELYADIPAKRAFAWVIDVIVITLLSLLLTPLTLFTSIFFFPLFFLCIGYAYRVTTLARKSATWGMRLLSIEIRDHMGDRLTLSSAFFHTTGYVVSVTIFPLQLISAVLMLSTPRAQGLTDMMLGSAAINRTTI